jgi:hypothetical protein
LWIEKEIQPAASMRQSLIYFAARFTLALMWLYQGLVPKLLFRHPNELAMLRATGLSDDGARNWCIGVGWAEVAIGLILMLTWRSRWVLWLTLLAMPAALLGVAIKSPGFLAAPFNPFALNLCVFALAAIALLAAKDLPSAARCIRKAPGVTP